MCGPSCSPVGSTATSSRTRTSTTSPRSPRGSPSRGPLLLDPGAPAARVDAAADRGGHRRPSLGRWLRDLPRVHDADRVGARPPGSARSGRRHHPGRRWHPAPAAIGRRGPRGRALPDRPDRRRRGGTPHRPPQRGAPDRRVPGGCHRVVPADQPSPRPSGVRRQAGGRRGAARLARRRLAPGGPAVPRPQRAPRTRRRGTQPSRVQHRTSAGWRAPDGVRPDDRRPPVAPHAGPGARRRSSRVLRPGRHRVGPHRVPGLRRRRAGGRPRPAHRRRRGVPAEPDGDRIGGVGAGRGLGRPLPTGARHAGQGPRRASVRKRVRAPGSSPPRVRGRAPSDLHGLPRGAAARPRGGVLEPVAPSRDVVAGSHRRARPSDRCRRRQPVDAADGWSRGRRCARAPPQHGPLPARHRPP